MAARLGKGRGGYADGRRDDSSAAATLDLWCPASGNLRGSLPLGGEPAYELQHRPGVLDAGLGFEAPRRVALRMELADRLLGGGISKSVAAHVAQLLALHANLLVVEAHPQQRPNVLGAIG